MARIAASIASGVFVLLSGALGVVATLWPPSDPATKAHFLDGLIVVTVLAVAALVGYVLLEDRERKADKAERERHNRMIVDIYQRGLTPKNEGITGTADPVQASQTMNAAATFQSASLRQASLDLAREIRELTRGADDDESQYNAFQKFFNGGYYRRLSGLKSRLESVLGWNQVTGPAHWLPLGNTNMRKIADQLEREAAKVPPDIPST